METKIDDWVLAARIAAEVLNYGRGMIVKGAGLLEVTEKIEKRIFELGGRPAFPVQISMDSTAAHFCPDMNDKTVFENQLAKLDVGVHVNGCIGDCAATVDLSGSNSELVKASENALNNAIKVIRAGATLSEIGRVIQETITSYGYAPIRNLSGHGLDVFDIHSKPTIPNFDTSDKAELKEGQIIAIEPFATTGQGVVMETTGATIFSVIQQKPVRNHVSKKVLEHLKQYEKLPFTTRWLAGLLPNYQIALALRDLRNQNIIREYPPLVEMGRGLVSQAEHTVLVKDDSCRILTAVDNG